MDAGHKIVGIGHNKLPDGVNEEKFPFWENRDIKQHGFMETKYPYGEHQLSPYPCMCVDVIIEQEILIDKLSSDIIILYL